MWNRPIKEEVAKIPRLYETENITCRSGVSLNRGPIWAL